MSFVIMEMGTQEREVLNFFKKKLKGIYNGYAINILFYFIFFGAEFCQFD